MKEILGVLLMTIFFVAPQVSAQELDAAATKRIVESKNYVFKARTVSPQRGQMRVLTSDYDLTVRRDSVIAWLPYFGRSYSADYGGEGGIKFTSAKNEYVAKRAKKKKWEINIKPSDAPDVQNVFLTIYDNGEANLQILSTNKDAISFSGYIKEGNPLEKKAF